MKAVVVRPDYFEIDHKVNQGLKKSFKINRERLFSQYDGFTQLLTNLGVEVIEIKQDINSVSMVFCGDWGFFKDNTFFLAKFKPQPRRKESKLARVFLENMGYKVITPPDRDYFTGADFYTIDGKYYFGCGRRSAIKTKEFLEKNLKDDVIDFKIEDIRHNQLDKCLGPIDGNTALYYLEALFMIEQARVCYHFLNPIPITEQDAKVYATAFIRIENNIIMPVGISDYLKEELKRLDLKIIEVDISEYLKAGQGLRSLALFL